MLLVVGRGFNGYDLWAAAPQSGTQLCRRTKSSSFLAAAQVLSGGSYLSVLAPPRKNPGAPIVVRVIEYTLSHPSCDPTEAPIRLITTLLDPELAPANELAALYAERWEEESAFDELKTHQPGAGRVLRSKSPKMVIEEICAHLLVHYAIGELITRSAEDAEIDPDRVSFIRTLRVIRRQVTDQAAFSRECLAAAIADANAETLRWLNKRQLRVNPMVINRKVSKWPFKRAQHCSPPRPKALRVETILITRYHCQYSGNGNLFAE